MRPPFAAPALSRALIALTLLATPMAARAAERLQVPQLPGWTVVSTINDATGQATELIPPGESADTWSRRVSIQAFRGRPMTVKDFLDQAAERTAPVCDGAWAGPATFGQVATGAAAGSRTVGCGRYKGDGQGSFMLYFVIGGHDAFYVVTRTWRGTPFAEGQVPVPTDELRDWSAFANAIDLCDTADPKRACRD